MGDSDRLDSLLALVLAGLAGVAVALAYMSATARFWLSSQLARLWGHPGVIVIYWALLAACVGYIFYVAIFFIPWLPSWQLGFGLG